jgi:hypothetical protein
MPFLDAGAARVVDEDERGAGLQLGFIISTILSPWTSPSAPPPTVKSWLATWTRRPSIAPEPVTTPSPGMSLPSMPKVRAAVLCEAVALVERPGVEQDVDALARGEVACGVVLGDALGAAAQHQHVGTLR